MKKIIPLAIIPLILSIGIISALPFADSYQPKDAETQCREGMVLVFRTIANDYVCLSKDSAERWKILGLGEIVGDTAEQKTIEKPMAEQASSYIAQAQTNEQPNIIIIMPDDVGWFNIGAYHEGIMAGITPNIDKIAE